MEEKMMDTVQIKKVVDTSHKNYIDAIFKFANKEISKEEFNKNRKEFNLAKKEILSLNPNLASEDYDPAVSFAYELDINKDNKIIEKELAKLSELKKDGEDKVRFLNEEIRNIKLRKNIQQIEKKEMIQPLQKQLIVAKQVVKKNKEEVKASTSKLRFIFKELGRISFYYSKAVNNRNILIAKNNFESKDGDLVNSWTIIGTKAELDAGITKTRDGQLLAENSRFFDKHNFYDHH